MHWLYARQNVANSKPTVGNAHLIWGDSLEAIRVHNTQIDRFGYATPLRFDGILFGLDRGADGLPLSMIDKIAKTKYIARFLLDEIDTTAFHTQWRRDEFEELAFMLYEYRDYVQMFTAMNQTFEEWRESYKGDNTY